MYKHCISFQTREAVETLMSQGVYKPKASRLNRTMRSDKTEFYQKLFNTEDLPIYAYHSMYCWETRYPIDAQTIGRTWAHLMGYMRLEDRYIIELDIPEEEAVIGLINDVKIWKDEKNEELEVVFTELSLEYVKMIAKPLSRDNGYGHVVYRPIYLKSDNVVFAEDIGFQGDGYGDNYEKFGWKEPEEGYTFSQLKRLMAQGAWDDFVKTVIPSSYSSKEKADYYKLIKDVKYIRR